MGLLHILKRNGIEKLVEQAAGIPGSVLVDVRGPEEYVAGHIPGSINVPLNALEGILDAAPEPGTAIYLYCLSGARSAVAAARLRKMGYARVTDMGGIRNWKGEIETGGTRE